METDAICIGLKFKHFVTAIKQLVARKYPGVDSSVAFREVLVSDILKTLDADEGWLALVLPTDAPRAFVAQTVFTAQAFPATMTPRCWTCSASTGNRCTELRQSPVLNCPRQLRSLRIGRYLTATRWTTA